MRAGYGVTVKGLNESLAQLDKLRGAVSLPLVERVLMDAADIMTNRAFALAPRGETGKLMKSFHTKPGKRRQYNPSAISIADYEPTRKKVKAGGWRSAPSRLGGRPHSRGQMKEFPYILGVEYGTAPHDILMPGGGVIHHPGSKPIGFFRRALAESRPRIRALIEHRMRKLILRAGSGERAAPTAPLSLQEPGFGMGWIG